nr:AGE family epimerase/isomerase [Paenibacillus bouchesdurhonensis]
MTEQANTAAWLAEIEAELNDNIMRFWMERTLDETNGGFIGEMDHVGKINGKAAKSLVLNARILWTFSAAHRIYPNAGYLQIADRAYAYLQDVFTDREFGGLYWMVDYTGQPIQDKKQVYGQAFVIYALSEYHLASGHPEPVQQAVQLFELLEKHSHDTVHQGYIEALARDWQVTDDLTLSDKDLNEKKSMNTHLHVLEAYTNLYRVWKSDHLKLKLTELIEVTLDYIINSGNAHFHLFFDEEWNVKSTHISYGHDIEGSWLLVEAAEVLEDNPALLDRVKQVAIAMAEAVLAKGVDKDGGLWNEADEHGLTDTNKDWWPQAEAMVGFYNAYQLTADSKFLKAAQGSWQFIRRFISDPVHGEWHWAVRQDGSPITHESKVSAWKCPYHNGRACLEMIARLNK